MGDRAASQRAAYAAFAGGDQAYLREQQYADSTKLAARANLHVRYGRADWFPWWAAQVPWSDAGVTRRLAVLEVGCGAGWLWEEAVGAVPADRIALTLTDLSSGMVDEAVGRAAGTGRYASVGGRTADAQHLPFLADSFDVVVANHMLYHLPDPALGVAELARVLRSGGVAAVATNGRAHLTELWGIRAEVFPGLADRSLVDDTVEAFGLETGEALLRARFEHVELHRYDDVLRCTDAADVVAFLESSPPGDTASADERATLRAVVARELDAGGGVLEVHKDVGVFVCRPRRCASAPFLTDLLGSRGRGT